MLVLAQNSSPGKEEYFFLSTFAHPIKALYSLFGIWNLRFGI
jgi:hypothetical protein